VINCSSGSNNANNQTFDSNVENTFSTPPKPDVRWPHAPLHKLAESGTFFVTAATYRKAHHFQGADRISVLHRGLLAVASEFGWQLEAWAVFSNHYHFVAHSPVGDRTAQSLGTMLGKLHGKTSSWINKLDGSAGRKVWHNYWETGLTHRTSYLARVNYVHQNAVKHGLVNTAWMYPWCSAGWFQRTATRAQVEIIFGMKTDLLNIPDDYEPSAKW